MGRRPRSRASRAERRMLKERAASALKHGLPVPAPPPSRTRAPNLPSARSSSAPPERAAEPIDRRMPLPVKLLGVGLLVLGVIYGLTLFRDHKSEPESASAAPEVEPASVGRVSPALAAVPSPSPSASDPGVSVSVPSVGTGAPSVAADLIGATRSVSAPRSAQVATAARPSRAPVPEQPSGSAAAVSGKALSAPLSGAPGARSNPPARPVDNPY